MRTNRIIINYFNEADIVTNSQVAYICRLSNKTE